MMKTVTSKIGLAWLVTSMWCAGPVFPADFRVTPMLGVTEDVTDNAYETSSQRKVESLTVVQPGFALMYSTPSSSLEGMYRLDYRYYAEQTSTNGINHTLALAGTFAVVDEFLKVGVSDTLSRISLDVARDTTAESANHGQADQNIATVSPYLDWHLSDKAELKSGGRYSDIRYWSSLGIDKREAGGFLELTDQVTSRLGLAARYVYNRTRTEPVIVRDNLTGYSRIEPVNYQDHSVSGSFRFEYADDCFLFGSVGNSWQRFSYRSRLDNIFWDAGLSNRFGATVATLEGKSRYTEDPLTVSLRQTTYSLKIDKTLPRPSDC